MAIFRKIHVTFWSDSFISNLEDKEKLFYLYLLTNERTTQLGVYEITKKQIAFDLGYSIDTVSKLILKMEKSNKIRYNEDTCEIAIKNWDKFNKNASLLVKTLMNKEGSRIKDKTLIEYVYSIDTVSIPYRQEEEEEEEEKEEELELRKKKFGKTLNPYLQQYGKEMLLEFYNYWTETMKSGKRFRQESEKAWDIKRRLSTWQSRDNKKETFVPLLNPFKGYPKHQLDND